jgi:hypothetical protein
MVGVLFFNEVIRETDFCQKVPLLFGQGLDSNDVVVEEEKKFELRHVEKSNKLQVVNRTADQAQGSEFTKI